MADLWWLMLGLGTAVFVLFLALLTKGLRRPPDGQGEVPGRGLWLVGGGVVLPLVLITVVFIATVAAMRDVPADAPGGALEIEVVAHQWFYEVAYPEQGVGTTNLMHIPVGRPIALRLHSADVIHSFWVPELGGKLDMLPDGVNTLVLQADEPGEFKARCAEFCGLQHARMEMVVVAQAPAEFAQWVEAQR